MRALLIGVLVGVLAVGGVLIGGSHWLAAQVRAAAADSPDLQIGSVTALRDGPRVGVHLRDVAFPGKVGPGLFPALDLWAELFDPTDFGARLPADMLVEGQRVVTEGGQLRVRFGPLSALAMTDAGARFDRLAGPVGPVLHDLDVTARLAVMGAEAPAGAGAGYDVTLALGQADVPTLPSVTAQGTARLWLTAAPGRDIWDSPPPPEFVGLRIDTLRLTAGDLSARVQGRVVRGADGFAEGRLAILTADTGGFVRLVAEAGAIPAPMAVIAQGAIAAASATTAPEGWPATAPGERLIPLEFREGRMFLGAVPLGPAPQFP